MAVQMMSKGSIQVTESILEKKGNPLIHFPNKKLSGSNSQDFVFICTLALHMERSSSEWTMCGTANSSFFFEIEWRTDILYEKSKCLCFCFGGVHRREKARYNIYIWYIFLHILHMLHTLDTFCNPLTLILSSLAEGVLINHCQ